MKRKLMGMMLAVILTVALLSGVFTNIAVQHIQRDTAASRLLSIVQLLSTDPLLSAQDSLDLVAVKQRIGQWTQLLNSGNQRDDQEYRITLIDGDGVVVADTVADATSMENHLMRPEVQSALQAGWGSHIRTSVTTDEPFLYAAVTLGDGQYVLRIAQPLSELTSTQWAITGWTVLGALVGMLLASFLGALLVRNFLAPLSRLREGTKKIAGGDYQYRVPVEDNEPGELALDFNAMACALQETISRERMERARLDSVLECTPVSIIAVDAQERLLALNPAAQELFEVTAAPLSDRVLADYLRNAGLIRAVRTTLVEGKGQCLEQSGERILRIVTAPIRLDPQAAPSGAVAIVEDITKIRQLENLRTEFVANVSHELKTPLTSIRGYTETLRSDLGNDAKLRSEILEILEIQTERLQSLVDDLLALAEIENASGPAVESCDLSEQATEAVRLLSPTAQAAGITLTTSLAPGLSIRAHSSRILRLITNLVDNAIKYNRPHGRVTVETLRLSDRVRLVVRDTGIGIPPEHHERIFERFYRIDKGRSRRLGGTGLGLSIVKHLVQLYGGDIHFDSIPGEGTTFYVDFPLAG